MKKTILISSIGIIAIIGAVFSSTKIYAYVQTTAFQNLVGHFISLGVIPSQNAAAAYSAIGNIQAGFTAATSLLTVSTDSITPPATTISALSGANGDEVLGAAALVFDIASDATNTVKITNINIYFGSSASPTLTTAYLFDGATQISSAPVINNNATFQNINYLIAGTQKKVFTVKIDAKNVNAPVTITPSVAAVTALDSQNNLIPVSGSAVGNILTIGTIAPVTSVSTTTVNQSQSFSVGSNGSVSSVPEIIVPPEIISYIQGSDQTQNTIHPSEETTIYGSNLPTNSTIHIGSQSVFGQTNTSGTQIAFTVPADLADGTYDIYVTSANAKQSSTVTVTSSTRLSISLLSPNGGENFGDRDTVTYSWTQNIASSSIQVSLIGYTSNTLYYVSSVVGALGQNTKSFSIGGLNVPLGQYIIKICSMDSICYSSTAPFNIIPETSGSSGGGSSSASQSSTLTLSPNQDYYFHITSGSITLADITNAGGMNPSPNGTPIDSLFFMPNNPPSWNDSASQIYFPYGGTLLTLVSGQGWIQAGNDSSFAPTTQQVSTYFIIRKGVNSTSGTFTIPSNISYDGMTAQNGQPRPSPWGQAPSTVVTLASSDFHIGGTVSMQWNMPSLSTVSGTLVAVDSNDAPTGSTYSIFSSLNGANGSYTWNVPTSIPTGSYEISIGSGSTNATSERFLLSN